MILGTGIDLCEVSRIKKAILAEHGERLVQRVFAAGEIAYAESKSNKYERYAARFAAKEAAMKALGTGWTENTAWRDIEVVNGPSGRPELVLHGGAAEIAEKMGVSRISLSITHTSETAMAIVILETA